MPTTSGHDIELTDVDGVTIWTFSVLAVTDDQGNDLQRTVEEALSAAQSETPIAEWLEEDIDKTWIGGYGISYSDAEAVYTRTDGYALPAGAVTQVTVPAGGTNTPIVAFAEFGADLYAAEEGNGTTGGRVLKLAGGTGAAFTVDRALAAGRILRDLVVFDDGSIAGVQALYAFHTDAGGGNGQLERLPAGGVWGASGAVFGAYGRNKVKTVFWKTNDGIGAWRMVTISGPNTISYTLPNQNPMTGSATWVEGVKIVTDSRLDTVAAARQHIWVGSKTNVYDLTADGDSPSLLGYDDRAPEGIPYPLMYMDGFLYRAAGGTLDRIKVDEGATLQEQPGQCAPGWGTAAESEWRGYPTALCQDQGYIVAAIWNPTSGKTGIFWGKPKSSFPPGALPDAALASPNPLVWYGPEAVSAGIQRVTAMAPSMLAGDRRLWIGSLNVTNTPIICWASLPVSGAPITDLISAGPHRFTTGSGGLWNAACYLRSMPETLGDENSPKFIHQVSLKTRGNDGAGTQVSLGLGADRVIGTTGYTVLGSTDTSAVEATFDPGVTVVAGYRIDYQVQWASPSGGATPPKVTILDSLRMTYWRIAPSFTVLNLTVQYGDQVTDRTGRMQEDKSPNDYSTALLNLTRGGRTILRATDDERYYVKLRQVRDAQVVETAGPYGKRVTCRLQIAILSSVT